ncbi:MAG: filamentous hemagglutinin N-terminal domain-containing protein [Negativicutes bacterium]|nr:filamentous hemagglutinin N-terminal domain-containing protein [Negativicutes bacterium]
MTSRKTMAVLALTLAMMLSAGAALAATPMQGWNVTYGTGSITAADAAAVSIASNKAILQGSALSLTGAQSLTVNFTAPSTSRFGNAALFRVTGNDKSTIEGNITVTGGAMFLVNRNGIVFGGGSVVTAPAFFATTLNISDAQFKAFTPTNSSADAWTMAFAAEPGTAGTIDLRDTAKLVTTPSVGGNEGGVIALMAKSINVAAGVTISAPNGTVMLMAAKQVTMSQSGSGNYGMFNIAYNTQTGNTITNSGTLDIRDTSSQGGGSVILVGDSVTHSGTILAPTRGDPSDPNTQKVSRILLVASGDVNVTSSSTTDASAAGNNRAGYVGIIAGGTATVESGAKIYAKGNGNDGGAVIIDGNRLAVSQTADINVSAPARTAGTVTKTANGGGDLSAQVEYARLAIRPNGDKMVLLNDGTLNLPPILPPSIKQEAQSFLSSTMKPSGGAPGTGTSPGTGPGDFKPADLKNPPSSVQSGDGKGGPTNSGPQGKDTTDNKDRTDK